MFDTGVFHAQNPWLLQNFGTAEGEGAKLVRSQWQALMQQPYFLKSLLKWLSTNALKLLGYKLGLAYQWLPRALVKKFAMNKVFWQQHT